ncbi:MAG: DUF58 domain-containing protein [Phycisphaerales bacterium]|nr:MAG: DUF58 domain-containing protein [Phycisphaerales bacterium]
MLRTPNPTRPRNADELLDPRLVAQIGRLDISSRRIFAGKLKGERRSKKRGESVEFADHRPYALGDDIRHIDWNIFGRLDRLFLKLFLEEEDLSLHLVLDATGSTDCGQPGKFLFMQKAAMALAYVGLVNLNRVAITAVGGAVETGGEKEEERGGHTGDLLGDGHGSESRATGTALHFVRDLRGRRRVHDASRFLCALRPGGDADFAEASKRIALARRGKGVMVVMSDFLMKEGYENALRLLVGRGYDVIALQVLSPQEVKPRETLAGDLRLRDIEDGDRAEVTISAPLLKRYERTLAAYCDGLRQFCARREMTHLLVTSDTPIDTLLLEYLRSRGVVR